MKRLLAALLATACVAAYAQERDDAGAFDEKHVQEKHLERIAIGVRVQQNLRVARDRDEARYAENRRRCLAALQVAELCGKFAGTFSCDAKGFRPVAPHLAIAPAARDNGSRNKMERCALDAARRNR